MDEATTSRWPAGHRAALVLSFDIDGEYGVINRYGADDWYWRSQATYDLETGIWRVLDILEDLDLQSTFCWVGRCAEDRPDAVQAAHQAGHESSTHGWDHRYYRDMTRDEQREDIQRTADAIASITGERPVGHKSPSWRFNEETVPALQELGFLWNMDIASRDLPYLHESGPDNYPLVQLPPSRLWEDYAFFVDQVVPPDDAYNSWREDIDVIRAEGKLMCLTFHPWVIGRPAPSQALVHFLDYVISLGDVWIARADQVSRWWLDSTREAETR
ncbi:MAG: polysaccharide deacetylase family protein [Thermomicrobiaceae bacterium]